MLGLRRVNYSTMAKRMKLDGIPEDLEKFMRFVEEERGKLCNGFKFDKTRVRVLSESQEVAENSNGILYYMTRDQRVQDNWSLLYAQKLALKNRVPLHVCFCLFTKYMNSTLRQYTFMLEGLKEVASELKVLNIHFHLMFSENGVETVLKLIEENNLGAVVVDFSPLKIATSWLEDLKKGLPKNIPLCQVDAHNIVPCWIASDKLEYGARTIRRKINDKLNQYLTGFPSVIVQPFFSDKIFPSNDWDKAMDKLEYDKTVKPVDWAKPGYDAGMAMLHSFYHKRLRKFGSKRNNPLENALSNLSPWFHFGQISIQRAVIHARAFRKFSDECKASVDSFCEEAIIRRELADNFCYYNKNYDSIEGAYDWAKKTLDDHRNDKREWLYTDEEFDEAKTHDDLWNSAQLQLRNEGKMHGFLRMYWAKKILEWSKTPEDALRIALYLNDRYNLDGRDPNGFVGCMWSICGIHDQGWKEREVFGKIRYMNYKGCERKFDVKGFVARYGGKVYTKKHQNKK